VTYTGGGWGLAAWRAVRWARICTVNLKIAHDQLQDELSWRETRRQYMASRTRLRVLHARLADRGILVPPGSPP